MRLRWRSIALVAGREFTERVRTRSFLLTTAAIVLLGAGGVAATELVEDFFDPGAARLGVTADAPGALTSALTDSAEALSVDLELETFETADAATEALRDESVDAVVLDGERLLFLDEDAQEEHEELALVVNQALRVVTLPEQLDRLDITAEEARSLLQPEPVTEDLLEEPEGAGVGGSEAGEGVGFLSVLILFLALSFYGNSILTGVVEEKSTRVVEVLLGSLSPAELLAGKVLGILSVAMTQFGAGVAAALAALAVTGTAELPAVAGETAVWLGVWLVLGLLLYSFVWATAGATVSRQEDASNASTPIMMLLLAGYMLTIFSILGDPDGTVAVVASVFPLTAPLTMPPRIAAGDPSAWQLAASLTLTVLTIFGVMWLAGRLYAGAVLRTGPRVRLLEAWRSARETRDAV